MSESPPVVALLVTCLVDLFRPSVAQAAVTLLERAGCRVAVPVQTCCGQAHASAGDRDGARRLARGMIRAFADFGSVIAPSASCVATVRDYPALFESGSAEHAAAVALAGRTVELTQFLARHGGTADGVPAATTVVAWHDGCAALRSLGIAAEPRALLGRIAGLELRELPGREECCGFGGAFCVKYPEISAAVADRKLDEVLATGAPVLAGADLGCLLHLEGRAQRRDLPLRTLHVAELLAQAAPGAPHDGD